jgi:hypothetical protein
MFTDLHTSEATWFLMSSKITKPNGSSMEVHCIVTKFLELENNHKKQMT